MNKTTTNVEPMITTVPSESQAEVVESMRVTDLLRVDTDPVILERRTPDVMNDEGVFVETWVEVIRYRPAGLAQALQTHTWLSERHPREEYRVRRPAAGIVRTSNVAETIAKLHEFMKAVWS